MHKLLILISIAVYCKADGLGGGVILGGAPVGVIPAAIKSSRSVEVLPVHLPQDPIVPQVIEVAPIELPVKILFNSRSSPVLLQQIHTPGAPGQTEKTSSEEEPHRVIHEVVRPVIQELREVIQPYRRIVQEIQPVVEQINTVVARGEPRAVVGPIAPIVAAPVAAVGAVGLGGGLVGNGGLGNGLLLNGGGLGLSGGRLLTSTLGSIGTKGGLLLGNGYKSASGKAAAAASSA